MRYQEFKTKCNDLQSHALFFQGDEPFFLAEAAEVLTAAYVTFPETDFDKFDSPKSAAEFSSALLSPPFLGQHRLVLVKEFYPTEKDLNSPAGKALKSFAKTAANPTVLAIIDQKPCPALENADGFTFINCSKESPAFFRDFAVKNFRKEGIAISSAAIDSLIEACAGSLSRLSEETEKLLSFAAFDKKIEREDVDALVHRDTELQVFALTTALAERRGEASYRALDVLLQNNEKPAMIFAAVYNSYRRMLHIRLSPKSDAELARTLGVKEYAVKKSRQSAAKYGKKSLKAACDFLSLLDYKMKSGEISADGVLPDAVSYLLSLQ